MKEISIQHIPAADPHPARVRVSYRSREDEVPRQAEIDFQFDLGQRHSDLFKWYFEQYLVAPWNEDRHRAQQAESVMEQTGTALFRAVFGDPRTAELYLQAADDLIQTRVFISADHPAVAVLPWELLRDPARGDYGDLSRTAYAFVRGRPTGLASPTTVELDDSTLNLLLITRPPGTEENRRFESIARLLLELFRGHQDRVRLEILRPASVKQLARILAEKRGFYHAVHLECPITLPADGKPPGLLLEDLEGKTEWAQCQELGGLLAEFHVPMVFASAAQSGMEHAETVYPWIGYQFIQEGVTAALVLPYVISRQIRARIWARVCEGMINGDELGSILRNVRADLRTNPERFSPAGDLPLRDWPVPVLFERSPVRLSFKPARPLRLRPDQLRDKQVPAHSEIDCPPLPQYGFIGRDRTLHELGKAWQTNGIILLKGERGIGKTEAAMGFVRWWGETAAQYGPVFCFHCEHYVPLSEICDRVTQLFHEEIRTQWRQDLPRLDAARRRALTLSILRQVPCLIVLNHFEFVAGYPTEAASEWTVAEQGRLRDFLSELVGGRTKVLIASCREEAWLGSICTTLEVGGLSLVEAQELALGVLAQAGLSTRQLRNLAPYNNLLIHLRGNPLAIELVAPDLRRKTADQILAALAAQANGAGRPDLLGAAFEYRLNTLDPGLRRRLSVLGLFDGYISARLLAAMSSLDDAPDLIRDLGREEWIRLLDAVSELGLIRKVAEGSYHIHPMIQLAWRDLLPKVFPDHGPWLERTFCALCGRAGNQLFQIFQANAEFALSLLHAEQHNLTRASRIARQNKDWDNLKEILCGLRALWISQGRWIEWEVLVAELETEVKAARETNPPGSDILWMRLLGHRAEICQYRQDTDGLRALHLSLKERFPRTSEGHKHEDVLDDLATIAEERRLLDEAERFLVKSLAIKQQFGDETGQANTLLRLGDLACQQRQFREAEQWFRQSREIWKRLGNADLQATLCCRLGAAGQQRGDFDEAEQAYQQSLAIRSRLGDEFRQALALHQLGRIAHERKQFDLAHERFRQSLEIRRKIGDEPGQAATWHQLGRMARDQQSFPEAERCFEQSRQIRERLNDEPGLAQTLHQLGNVAFLQGRLEQAESFYRHSLEIREQLQDLHGQSRSLNQLGKIASARGDNTLADQFFNRAEALFEQLRNPLSGLGPHW
ncbi:MAG: tetratricopeptide repeat protein [Candidatus Omnitrophica bacterium]|nr:tetratricopeptide repeat protein [Candidatus Omnitrophota bacterium]